MQFYASFHSSPALTDTSLTFSNPPIPSTETFGFVTDVADQNFGRLSGIFFIRLVRIMPSQNSMSLKIS